MDKALEQKLKEKQLNFEAQESILSISVITQGLF